MKVFHLSAHVAFEAESIDDACRRLALHFQSLADDDDSEDRRIPFIVGSIELKPEHGG